MKRIVFAVIALVFGLCVVCPAMAGSAPEAGCRHAHASFEKDVGYCQAVRSGDTLYVSGTAAPGKMPAAVKSVYEQLRTTLAANGLDFSDVVMETVYTTQLDAFKKQEDLRKQFYGDNLPAATWVEVKRLFTPNLVLEVELVATYPQ